MARKKKTETIEAGGVVERVNKKRIDTVNGKKPVYSFLLDDDEWYRTGFKKPDIEEGDEVEFEYEETEYGLEVVMDTLEVTGHTDPDDDDEDEDDDDEEEEEKPARSSSKKKSTAKKKSTTKSRKKATTKSKSSSSKKSMTRDEYWERKEQRDVDKDIVIQYQASRNSAIAYANVLIANGLVEVPKTRAKKESLLADIVEEYTNIYFAQTGNVEALKELRADAEVDQDDDED